MIVRTEAIVLRSMRYGESSRIATLFTRQKGKISVIAKGARRTKSRFGSAMLPMSYTEVVFYYKSGRSLHTVSESSHLLRFPNLARDLTKISIGLRAMELVDAVLQEEESNPILFNSTLQLLQRLNIAEQHVANLLPFFELRLAADLGFAPLIEKHVVEQLPEAGGVLVLERGAIEVSESSAASVRASRPALRAFAVLSRADAETVLRMRLNDRLRQEVDRLTEAYLKYHLEESYPTRARKVTGSLSA